MYMCVLTSFLANVYVNLRFSLNIFNAMSPFFSCLQLQPKSVPPPPSHLFLQTLYLPWCQFLQPISFFFFVILVQICMYVCMSHCDSANEFVPQIITTRRLPLYKAYGGAMKRVKPSDRYHRLPCPLLFPFTLYAYPHMDMRLVEICYHNVYN